MTALELVQEAAKRLLIMIPNTLVQELNHNTTDYDSVLLLSCLNSMVKQNMTLNLFNRQILIKSINMLDNDNVYFLKNLVDKNPVYSDFVINLSNLCPDMEEIMGDGFNFSIYEVSEPTLYKKKSYLFRQITPIDYLRLKKTCLPNVDLISSKNKEIVDFSQFASLRKDFDKEIKEYKKNMPSENRTNMINAENKESGFIVLGDGQTNKILYFCNNMIPDAEIYQEYDTFAQSPTLEFLYRTNYGVISDMGERVDSIPYIEPPTPPLEPNPNKFTLVIPDELAILGTVINYKSYYGIDYTLELGQYKQMIDMIKENQENIQITHLDKKQYFPIRNI
jgi:hypothetical protein